MVFSRRRAALQKSRYVPHDDIECGIGETVGPGPCRAAHVLSGSETICSGTSDFSGNSKEIWNGSARRSFIPQVDLSISTMRHYIITDGLAAAALAIAVLAGVSLFTGSSVGKTDPLYSAVSWLEPSAPGGDSLKGGGG